jgi:hypothetical protein
MLNDARNATKQVRHAQAQNHAQQNSYVQVDIHGRITP